MTTITREQLIKKAQEQIAFCRDTKVTGEGRAHVDQCAALFEIALAAIDSEPVAWLWSRDGDDERDVSLTPPEVDDDAADAIECGWTATPLYRHAQPAPERDQVRREHAEWSQATFGNVGPVGPLKHLSKEALEAAADPGDLSEWADMQFLMWDAQRRAGITDEQITQAMIEKLAVNKQREWPEPKDGEPRLHIKEQAEPVVPDEILCEFYEVANWPDLVRELVKHVEQLQDSAKRNVKPWEDTFPETLLPAYIERIKQADEACCAAMLQAAPVRSSMPDGVVTAEHRRVIGMLLSVCGAAFKLADDSCQQNVDGEECHVVPSDAFQKLSDALDEIENTLPTEDIDRPDVFLAWSAMPRAALKSLLQAGNSQTIPEGYVMVPLRLTAENGAKEALSGEFSETRFVNCPECFSDDECETCDGSGRIEITVPVTWTTIKAIWVKGVEHFAATAQEND